MKLKWTKTPNPVMREGANCSIKYWLMKTEYGTIRSGHLQQKRNGDFYFVEVGSGSRYEIKESGLFVEVE